MTGTLGADCLVTGHMISVLTQRRVMKASGAHSGGRTLWITAASQTPSAHISVPLTPADCDGVFITQRARGILQRALLRGGDCSVGKTLSLCWIGPMIGWSFVCQDRVPPPPPLISLHPHVNQSHFLIVRGGKE